MQSTFKKALQILSTRNQGFMAHLKSISLSKIGLNVRNRPQMYRELYIEADSIH